MSDHNERKSMNSRRTFIVGVSDASVAAAAATTGLPTTHKPTSAYIMWAGSPYAHLHVMGRR
jgi:hypothetical protein